ncbi:MAG: 30S ribosomal protein S17e [Candidatus Woesearchaeota archaeon]|nr:30S ribosomal protein S17e [Candidatus Woesearchaeota archaeon]MDP7323033.1 30S ribosomal protein S17e [Candidatus Woesearchaeota archaeon]MDP7476759.1 30S ribosomal protein S17e [Candidatus Woesearchaeota archaeon]HJO01550.1 30S ribosomal protein S17e [Candidatus Woesearchaeota archaeon]
MGRIKTILVKRVTKQLVKEHSEELSEDYNKNKEVLKKYVNIKSPKIRNVIAGYAARLVKQSKEDKEKRSINKEDLSKFY